MTIQRKFVVEENDDRSYDVFIYELDRPGLGYRLTCHWHEPLGIGLKDLLQLFKDMRHNEGVKPCKPTTNPDSH